MQPHMDDKSNLFYYHRHHQIGERRGQRSGEVDGRRTVLACRSMSSISNNNVCNLSVSRSNTVSWPSYGPVVMQSVYLSIHPTTHTRSHRPFHNKSRGFAWLLLLYDRMIEFSLLCNRHHPAVEKMWVARAICCDCNKKGDCTWKSFSHFSTRGRKRRKTNETEIECVTKSVMQTRVKIDVTFNNKTNDQ